MRSLNSLEAKTKLEVASLRTPAWQSDLTFLFDVTQHLNDLNLKLQGKN